MNSAPAAAVPRHAQTLDRLRLERGAAATPILVRRPARSPEAMLLMRVRSCSC
jgi:hypothetical protein